MLDGVQTGMCASLMHDMVVGVQGVAVGVHNMIMMDLVLGYDHEQEHDHKEEENGDHDGYVYQENGPIIRYQDGPFELIAFMAHLVPYLERHLIFSLFRI